MTIKLQSPEFNTVHGSMDWSYTLPAEGWDIVPANYLDHKQVIHVYGQNLLRPLLASLKKYVLNFPEFNNTLPLTLTVDEDGYPRESYTVQWPDLNDSFEDPYGEDTAAFYMFPTTMAKEETLQLQPGFVDLPAGCVTNPQTSIRHLDRISYTGRDVEVYVNNKRMECFESITWADDGGSITGNIVFVQYEQHPIYELLDDNRVLGEGEPLNSEGNVIRKLSDMDPFDIVLVYTHDLGVSSTSALIGVKFQGELNGVSASDLISCVSGSFTAHDVLPLRKTLSAYKQTARTELENFSWSRTDGSTHNQVQNLNPHNYFGI